MSCDLEFENTKLAAVKRMADKIEALEKRLTEMERRYDAMVKAFDDIYFTHSIAIRYNTDLIHEAVTILSENNDDIS